MSEFTLYNTADEQKRNLTFRFVVTGLIAALLIVLLITASGYYLLRSYGLESTLVDVAEQMDAYQKRLPEAELVSTVVAVEPQEKDSGSVSRRTAEANIEASRLAALGIKLKSLNHVTSVSLYNQKNQSLWASKAGLRLSDSQMLDLPELYKQKKRFKIYDNNFLALDAWMDIVRVVPTPLASLIQLRDKNGATIAVAKIMLNVDHELAGARDFGVRLFAFVSLGILFLFLVLYFSFRRGVQTIEDQEERLNQQITRLSNLLSINKTMQKSMKTASARAVELNEQFLRRVGADLHDGPAQMIGYAVLRLNKLSRDQAVKELGHEFHAVKEALDESLDEIRGISSGLVLPELESLSLEQCLRKVVALHGANSNTKVTQYYVDLEYDMPLPVKITAYRFIQEGLNNSHRHGQAEKCRITAQVKNGELFLSLKDNGMGFRMSQLQADGGRLGLLGLKDRVESLGGKFSINSELGIGTALKISIMLVDEETA
jgi:signal transduction histidine kinase